ncbi:ROK family transcriptional regulator [Clostridium thermarum]|uniref:ROK family transcriptional regulator n=1 Tax=Clostridium thermarum TaxID=1716543 RepID=UPI001A9C0AD6|nr:ROK family protein [Clostridium thermarum]
MLRDLAGRPKVMATVNREMIRSALLELGSATKAELSKYCGISSPTVGKVLETLRKNEEIIELGYDDSSGGRRAMRYSINAEKILGLTLFLEQKETIYSVYKCTGETLISGRLDGEFLKSLDSIEMIVSGLLKEHPNIASISIGVPGAVKNGEIFFIPDYDAFKGVNLKKYFEERFNLPVVIENDMNAAVIGYHEVLKQTSLKIEEPLDSKAKLHDISITYLYLGNNGPGTGILINGEVVRGSTCFAGEVSFIPIYDKENFFQRTRQNGVTKLDIDAVSRLITAFVTIINPQYIVLCKKDIDQSDLLEIIENCSKYFPMEHMPDLRIRENWKEDYTLGLKTLGLKSMFSGIKIIRD